MQQHKIRSEIKMYQEAEEFNLKAKESLTNIGLKSAGLKALEELRNKNENLPEREQHQYFNKQLKNGKGSFFFSYADTDLQK